MNVTVSGASGLTNAYTSVLSATGSFEISGASRCDDMCYLTAHRAETLTDRRLVSLAAAPIQEPGKVPVVQPGLTVAAEHIDLPGSGVPDVDDKLLAVVSGELISGAAL